MPRLRPAREPEQPKPGAVAPETEEREAPETEQETLSAEGAQEAPEREEAPQPSAEEVLKKQVEELRKAEQLQRDRAVQAERAREEAIRKAREREVEVTKSRGELLQTRKDAISAALAAAKSEADSAQREIENAAAVGDTKAQAEAYRKLSRAEANIVDLERGDAAIKAEEKSLEAETAKPSTQQEDPLDKTGLPDTAKNWLRSHPDYMSDPRKNAKIQALHYDVLDEGHSAFSPEYFESLERHLGLREKEPAPQREQPQQQRGPLVSAPVSREAPSSDGVTRPGLIRLTAAQREAAKMAGITEKQYAEQLSKLTEMRANGSYGERQ